MKEPELAVDSSVLEVMSSIVSAIEEGVPFSMVRLGDGEGRVLAYPELISKTELDFSLDIWFGRTDFDLETLIQISEQLRASISSADVIGVPRAKQRNAMAYQYVFDVINRDRLASDTSLICDAAVHRYLQFGLFYRDILFKRDFVGLINGRDISQKIEAVFQVKNTKFYSVPQEAKYADGFVDRHYPDFFKSIEENLYVPYPGALFLVGAGVLGKIYCHWIKSRGGIALDIGAIFDSWAGSGRLQDSHHSLDNYANYDSLSLNDRLEKFNTCCDYFDIDTDRL